MIAMSVAAASRKTPAPVSTCAPPVPVERLYRFSAEQYDRMAEVGIFRPDDRAELIEGWIVKKMGQHPPHARSIMRLNKQLLRLLSDEWELRVQMPIALAHSRPEPDVGIVRGPDGRYEDRHPRPAEIALLIEVGDSSLLADRRSKLPLYAAGKIVEVWLVNLVQGQIEVYTQPRGGRSAAFRQRQDYVPGQEVPLLLEGKEIARLSVSFLCLLED
ncbi:MAG: Uma2 family endonuclease [Gemmataceae bacterium]|nr:Uma2 family endonuclease [Gemmataceae bacterium]